MNILILMAGRGTRFHDLDPETPKPLVKLHGHSLVEWVVRNLKFQGDHKYIFVTLKKNSETYKLEELFSSWNINFSIVESENVTEGAAISALLAKSLIEQDELLIANSDQLVLFNQSMFLENARKSDGCIISMKASGPKWSYIKTDRNNFVTEVREKKEISNTGTVGVYYFKSGSMFIKAVNDMVDANDRHNNEFYLAPCYNYMIAKGNKVTHFNVGEVHREMIGLGTAEDFLKFQSNPLSLQLKEKLFT